ncbi:lactonase family protein [Horticoccus sp. 23ND18S-11]|uniref:lactonase family protein n=1 Tax=Horticoccus sp. 23ND18S-11 TaxID=3391832 RepID=UPI0039C8CBDE
MCSAPALSFTSRATRRHVLAAAAASLALLSTLAGAPAQPPRGPLMAYVATYSSPPVDTPPGKVDLPPGNGRGIHLFQVDRTTGALSPAGVFELATSPSCVVANAAGTRLYSTNATDKVDGGTSGTISAFAIDPASGGLTLLNTVSSGGLGPTYISVHPSGHYVLVANYAGGSVAVFPLRPDGSLETASQVLKHSGVVGPKKATNAPIGSFAFSGHDFPHAHMIQPDASGRFVLAADLGLDQLLVWKFDATAGRLQPAAQPVIALPPGDGPRHFAFHPDGRRLYSLQEEASTIVVFDYDATNGRLTQRQTLSSLPPEFRGSNFTSGILVSADGRFVYAANRLHDSIAWFAVGADGTLTFVGEEWTRGDYPRSFAFDPTGRFLYSCNQRSDAVTVFRVNAQTGALSFTGQYTPVGNPSVIAFLDLGAGR